MLFVILRRHDRVRPLEHSPLCCVAVCDWTGLKAGRDKTVVLFENVGHKKTVAIPKYRKTGSNLGGIDFMLLSGSSNTLGQASGVTEM